MFFSNGDEDDGGGFTVPPTSQPTSKLQSLFGGEEQTSKGANESLVYQPQKQPKAKSDKKQHKQQQHQQQQQGPQTTDHQKSEGPSLMHACVCMTYRYVNGQYVSQGKLGMAVLGNYTSKDYKLLVYASQKKAVTSAKIHPTFAFKVQKNNYASFYDDQSHNWSVCFESEEQLMETAKRVTMGKFNMAPSNLVIQDLNQIEGQELQKGDTVEVQFTGWLLDGNRVGKCFDSSDTSGRNPKFKLGRGKVIKGWDVGILGMKKLSKRLIIVPPEMAADTRDVGPQVPPGQVLIFQVEVMRVKYAHQQQDNDMASLAGSLDMEKNGSDVDYYDAKDDLNMAAESLSVRKKSISEQLEKPDNVKAKLLERMSKMGQAMVPPVVTNADDDSDDESVKLHSRPPPPESPDPTPKTKHPVSIDTPMPSMPAATPNDMPRQTSLYQPQQQLHHQQQMLLQQQQQQQQQHAMQQQTQELALYKSPHLMGYQPHSGAVPPQAVPHQPHIVAQPPPGSGVSTTEMNLMLTDGRLKHTELKTDLNRIVDKMDAMSEKLNTIENLNKQLQLAPSQPQGQEMEAIVIMQNVTRIIKENEKFRTECDEKSKKIELLNERMTDLLTRNQQFFEQSNQLLATQTDSMQTTTANALVKVTHLEEQNMRLQTELAEQRSQLLETRGQKDVVMKSESHLSATIESLTQELTLAKENTDSARQLLAAREAIIEDLQDKIKNTRVDQKQNQMSVVQLQEDIVELKAEKESMSKILAEVKNKRKNEKEKYDEDLHELKRQHEEDIKSLRERYKKNIGDESEKIARVEEDLAQQYEERMRMKTKSLEKSHKGALQQAEEEKELLRRDMKMMKEKMSNQDDEHGHKLRMELENLREKMLLEHSRVIKALNERNESLSTKLKDAEQELIHQSTTQYQSEQTSEQQQQLQQQYNQLLDKLKDKTEEISSLKLECDNAYDHGMTAGRATVESISKASYVKGFAEGEAAAGEVRKASQERIVEEVKKVMNAVFFQTKAKFESSRKYDGKHVVATLLDTIKETTLKLTEKESERESEEEEEEEEESEEEEEEEEILEPKTKNKSTEDSPANEVSKINAVTNANTGIESSEKVEPGELIVEEAAPISAEVIVSQEITAANQTADVSVDTDYAPSTISVDSCDLRALPPLTSESEPPPLQADDVPAESDKPDTPIKEQQPLHSDNTRVPFEGGEIDANLGAFVAIETSTLPTTSSAEAASQEGESDEEEENYATDEGEDDKQEPVNNDLVTELVNVVDDSVASQDDEHEKSSSPKASTMNEEQLSEPDTRQVELSDDDSPIDNVLTIATDDSVTPGQSDDTVGGRTQDDKVESENESKSDSLASGRNALSDLGLDSSMFGAPPVEESEDEEGDLFTDPRKDSVSSVDNPPPGPSTTKQPKEEESSTRTSTKSSIFEDDDEDDDDLFNPRVKHKVSAFVRSPPPLFDDDDGDVNWI